MWLRPRRSGPLQILPQVIFIKFRGPQALKDSLLGSKEPTLLCNHVPSANSPGTSSRSYLAVLLSAVTLLAFIDDLNIVAVRIKHPSRIIARIVFETSLR
jgi:hypothetical protein